VMLQIKPIRHAQEANGSVSSPDQPVRALPEPVSGA
jgi:hypothetical protein